MPVKDPASNVQFHFKHSSLSLKDRRRVKLFLLDIFKKEKTRLASLTYIFCSDEDILEINQQFLHHNYYTDIISFNLANKNAAVEGEIYISLDRVKDNAKQLRQYSYIELHRVIFHGVLHLCGYKDKSPKELAEMRSKEDYYLHSYFK